MQETSLSLSTLLRVLICLSSAVLSIGIETVYDKSTGAVLGTRDVLEGKTDPRLMQTLSINRVQMDVSTESSFDLGLKSWGPIQTTALLVQNLEGAKNLDTPLCKVTHERVDYHLTDAVALGGSADSLHDYEVNEDKVYTLTSDGEVVAVKVELNEHGEPSLKELWRMSNLHTLVKDSSQKDFKEAGLAIHKQRGWLYIPTDTSMIIIEPEFRRARVVAEREYIPNENIVRVDILGDFLFIGYKYKGIYVYDISKIEYIHYMGRIDGDYWGLGVGKQPTINDFVVHHSLVEFMGVQTDDRKEPALFPSLSGDDREKIVRKDDLDFPLLIVAESSGIYFLDLSSLVQSQALSRQFLKVSLPYKDVKRIARHHSTLLLLQHLNLNSTSPFEYKSIATEVILIAESQKVWQSSDPAKIYVANRELNFVDRFHEIFVDESYIYVLCDKNMYVAERGVPKEFANSAVRLGIIVAEPYVSALAKIYIRGKPILISFTPSAVTSLEVFVDDPHLLCSVKKGTKIPNGEYFISINATTRSCPLKETSRIENTGTNISLTVCVWKREIVVEVSSSILNIVTPKDSSMIANFAILACCIACICVAIVFYRNNKLRAEYNILRKEMENSRVGERAFQKVDTQGSARSNENKPERRTSFDRVNTDPAQTKNDDSLNASYEKYSIKKKKSQTQQNKEEGGNTSPVTKPQLTEEV